MISSSGMDQEDFKATWQRMYDESLELEDRRNILETELNEVKRQIAHIEGALNHLRPLAGLSEDVAALGITDAIRLVLKNSKERMSPSDVRRTLHTKGFDLSGYSAPMASVYKILSRLADDPKQLVGRERDENGVFYRWVTDEYAQSAEISDDDIPF